MHASSPSPSSPAPANMARDAASACLSALSDASSFLPQHASPRRALGAMAGSLNRQGESAASLHIVRSEIQDAPDDAWNVAASVSAWPLRYRAEMPLLYLCRPESLAALRGVLVDSRERGIVCNDAETQVSRWPKGVQPVLPAWLAAQANCTPFDPANGEEVRAIMCAALETLYVDEQPGYFYLAMHDEERYAEPLSADDAAAASLGMYRLPPLDTAPAQLRLCGAGRALALVQEAARLLRDDWQIKVEVWSCPSYTRLARDGQAAEVWSLHHPGATPRQAHVQRCLGGSAAPTIAVTGYAQHIAGQIGGFVRGNFKAIGADSHSELCADWLVVLALKALADENSISVQSVEQALQRYSLV